MNFAQRWKDFTLAELYSLKNALTVRHGIIPMTQVDRSLLHELENELEERTPPLKRAE